MNEEAKQILAFIFKRSGKKTLPSSDVYLAIPMELQWCSPKEAKAFVKQAVLASLLSEHDEGLTPSFEVEQVSIPTGFKPSRDCFKSLDLPKSSPVNESLISRVIQRVQNETTIAENDIKQGIKILAIEKLISDEVAALFFMKKKGLNIKDLIPFVKKNMVTSEKNKA